jgi:glycosyltransferase involved in cell wall biosynthesis
MSGSDPRISLVTPSFNQAEYLEETLRSVLDQGYPDLEYVVIDGGSSDGSVEIIGRYADRLAAWVSEPDDGHTDGLDKGFARTSGEIMGWINSSDVQFPWTLRTVAEVFHDVPEAQWIMGLQTHVARGGGPKSVYNGAWNVYDFLAGQYRWLQQESVFWRRGLWNRAGGRIDPAARYTCDFSLWLRFMELAPLYHVDVPLGGFRHHDERRGAAAGGAYAAEAREQWLRWQAAAAAANRRRGRLVGALPAPLATPWRAFLERSTLTPWYRHERVGYDFDADIWAVR